MNLLLDIDLFYKILTILYLYIIIINNNKFIYE